MKQKLSKKFAYWLGVIVVGIALGFAIQFVRAWTEPTGTPPSSNVGRADQYWKRYSSENGDFGSKLKWKSSWLHGTW